MTRTPTDPVTDEGARDESDPEPPPPPTPARGALPPDVAEYDSERSRAARARGLSAPYIAGGRDPEPEAGIQEERRYLRYLLIMVAVIIVGGFVLGIIANLMSASGGG